MKNEWAHILPHALSSNEVVRLRSNMHEIQRLGYTKQAIESLLPLDVYNKFPTDDGTGAARQIVDSLLHSLDLRLTVEITIAVPPSVILVKKIRTIVRKMFTQPITMIIKIDPTIVGGVIITAQGHRYDKSLGASLLSHENIQRIS